MSRTRPAVVAAILLLMLPTLLVVSPAALAQDPVPLAPGATYTVQTPFTHKLYLRFADRNQATPEIPVCDSTSLAFAPHGSDETSPRADCVFPVGTGGGDTPAGDLGAARTFATANLARSFNVTGANSVVYYHVGSLSAGTTLTAEVFTGPDRVGTGTLVVTAANEDVPGDRDIDHAIPIVFDGNTNRTTFRADLPLRLVLRASPTPTDATGSLTAPRSYTLSDAGSRLEVQGQDSIRAGAWVGETRGAPKTLFRPLPTSVPAAEAPRIQFYFSVQSAFGFEDAYLAPEDGGAPTHFTLTRAGEPVFLNTARETQLTGTYNSSMSQPSRGIATWTLRTGEPVDYRGFTPGEYVMHVAARHRQGLGYSGGTTAPFLISAQGVTLDVFKETDRAVSLSPESAGHEVAAGSDTTYLLLVNNTGSANDTFRLEASFVTGSPATGWSATVGGPSVSQRSVQVPPGEPQLVTVTVRAPAGAPAGASSIFRVNATSTVDPSVVSQTLTLSTTISNAARREVAILVPRPTLEVDAGADTRFPVYVWNRGTRPADVSLELHQTGAPGWTVDLLQGGLPTTRVILSNIPPGAIAEATVRANGPEARNHVVSLNATMLEATGVSFERTLRFVTTGAGGVSVQVLESIGGQTHDAEVQGTFLDPVTGMPVPGGDPRCGTDDVSAGNTCLADNATGVWFRVWVTNTGKVREGYNLSLESIDYARVRNGCTSAFTGYDPYTPGFQFYARSRSGAPRAISDLPALDPGETAEVYVWRSVGGLENPCADAEENVDFFRFVVTARGLVSGFVGTAKAEAFARNSGGSQGVLLEPVSRTGTLNPGAPDSGPFRVDVANVTRGSVTGTVDVNASKPYRIRLTNAASWGPYADEDGDGHAPIVQVTISGNEAKSKGWNASIRPILDEADNGPKVGDSIYNFSTERDGRVEAWRDIELEVLVTPPSAANGSAFAGQSGYFTISARMPGREGVSFLDIITTIGESADVQVRSDPPALQAHAGEASASLLLVQNLGSIAANVTVRPSVDPSSQNAGAWRVDPSSQNFRLSAAKNRTLALLVTPPPGASAGSTGTVNVVLEYSPSSKPNQTLQIPVAVVPAGTLEVTVPQTDATVAPGGYANFTVNVRNKGNLPIPFRLSATALPDWDTSIATPEGTLAAGESRSIPYVLRAPLAAENNARFASVVRAVEIGNDANFDAQPLAINILGGKAVPGLTAPLLERRVDRGQAQVFPVEVRNAGNAVGRLNVEARSADPAWVVSLQNDRSENVSFVRLGPNEVAVLNLTVTAPAVVPERTVVPIEVTASSDDFSQSSKIAVRAEVHDYGVAISLSPSRLDAVPGVPSEFVLKVRNLGNDNDTLNVSAHLAELRGWNVSLSTTRLPLAAGEEGEVRAIVRSPRDPLPTSRTYDLKFWAGTVGGLAVGLPKNESVNAAVSILPYRAYDVDKDEQLEVVVDADGRTANGYESFREPFADGFQTGVVAVGFLDGRARLFLDVPRDGAADGFADVWFDPDAVYAYDITLAPDVNNDGTPEYFLDTDRDRKIDLAYDTVTELYWNVTEIDALGDGGVQYVIDSTRDGRPDHYYDPVAQRATRVQGVSGQGANTVGLDTDNDGKVDKYFDYRTNSVTDVTFANASGFLGKYWWFFVLFGLVVVATIALLVARRRRG